MNIIKKLSQQRKAYLANGTEVEENNEITFVNSDGVKCTDKVRRREDGSLYFWNTAFNIEYYHSAVKAGIVINLNGQATGNGHLKYGIQSRSLN